MLANAKLRWFILAVALQLVIVIGLAARHYFTVFTGVTVLLRTEAVDPWDMFRGDYARLNFEINTLPARLATGKIPAPGDKVWVLLEPPAPGEKYWSAVTVSLARPQSKSGQVAVRAKVVYAYEQMLHLEYGFEQFFVPEGQGLRIEHEHHRVDVEVAVDRFGRPVLKRVLWDGEPIEWASPGHERRGNPAGNITGAGERQPLCCLRLSVCRRPET